eukprot:m.560386 g.560386  ORF g.560386 m.560386 type:complete len:90 (+) comp22210_c0_seq16:183-452(+)
MTAFLTRTCLQDRTRWLEAFAKAGVRVLGAVEKKEPTKEIDVQNMRMSNCDLMSVMHRVRDGEISVADAMGEVKKRESSLADESPPADS